MGMFLFCATHCEHTHVYVPHFNLIPQLHGAGLIISILQIRTPRICKIK